VTRFDSPFHRIHVDDVGFVRVLRFERNRQSSMRLDDPFETDIDYCGYLHIAIAVTPDPTSALMIGLGGGSVVKRMWRDYPDLQLDVVELDPEVVEIAHELFAVPRDERIRVAVADGRDFLTMSDERYDIVIVDAFDDDRVPRTLLTEEFMRDVREHLAPGGVAAWNLIGHMSGMHSGLFRSLYRTAANVWRDVWVFPVGFAHEPDDSVRNIEVFASDAEISPDELLDRIADRVGGRVTVPEFERFGEDFFEGPIRTADVPLLTDPPVRPARLRRR
jgi:spermidine synthase